MTMSPSATPKSALRLISSPSSLPEAMDNSSPQLTPRSKVKAMLAAIDSSSDEGSIVPARHCIRRKKGLSIESETQSKAQTGSDEVAGTGHDEDAQHSDASDIVPQGGLVKKLHEQALEDQSSRGLESLSPDHAYARIKQQLSKAHTKGDDSLSLQMNKASTDTASSCSNVIAKAGKPRKARSRSKVACADASIRRSPTLSPSIIQASTNKSPGLISSMRILDDADSETDDFQQAELQNSRFHELVARKRAERQAKQAEAEQKQARRPQSGQQTVSSIGQDVSASSSASEDDVGGKFTQSARPTRKASKKALEEMARETQRMNRNMQLAHQARTKKRISKDSLFARFKFRTSLPFQAATAAAPMSSSTVASSAPISDAEPTLEGNSPLTSPSTPSKVSPTRGIEKISDPSPSSKTHPMDLDCNDLPEMTAVFEQGRSQNKEITRAGSPSLSHASQQDVHLPAHRRFRISRARDAVSNEIVDLDSDSETEHMPSRHANPSTKTNSRLDAFERLPIGKMQEARSLLTLRALANLNAPHNSRNGMKSMLSIGDMQTSLQKRARQQALEERKAKVEDLKARGILIQSAEEREQDQAEVEDMLEKARREAQELMQKEKRAAKSSGSINGNTNYLNDTSDDDDEDYQVNEAEDADIELSGSDQEQEREGSPNATFDCSESNDDDDDAQGMEQESSGSGDSVDEDVETYGDEIQADPTGKDTVTSVEAAENCRQSHYRRPRRRVVDFDEEDEVDEDAKLVKNSVQDHATTHVDIADNQAPICPLISGAYGSTASTFGLTQAFAATMADECELDKQDSNAELGPPPEPSIPIDFAVLPHQMIMDSQHGVGQDTGASHYVDLHFSQSQVRQESSNETQSQRPATQLSEIPEPTQDAGFMLSSPAPERFVSLPPSTVDTILLPSKEVVEISVAKKKGRLYQRLDVQSVSDDENLLLPVASETMNAFDVMANTRQEATEHKSFNKKKSEAKEMIEEQAQESEDDYAGMGGASDDESGGELDEYVEAMMDHGEVDVDERALASLHADKERASDEKAVERLFKDINNGGLRRKRGADFDLTDSDDDREARRRRKQREFAKMRKALLADEKVGQIAEDPKKLAFLRAIEDRGGDEDLDFLDRPAQDSFYVEPDTQEDSHTMQVPATQDGEGSKVKRMRPLQEIDPNMRPPASARRTAASSKKPSTLLEIRDSVSFLTELPGAMCVPEPSSSADEAEDASANDGHIHPRRTASNQIVDRLLLKRQSSSSMQSSSSRLAFYDPSAASNDGFKVPSLLRRATTNLSLDGAPDKNGISTYATTERAAGGGEQGDFVKKGGSKKSSVNYFAREQERLAAVKVIEKRRQQDREKRAKERRSGGLGRLVSAGGFD